MVRPDVAFRLACPCDWLYWCIVRPGAVGCGAAWLDSLPLPVAALRYPAPFGGASAGLGVYKKVGSIPAPSSEDRKEIVL